MEKVIIIGGGHVGLTLAVDLHQRQHETQLEPHVVLIRGENHPFFNQGASEIAVENIITGEKSAHVFPQANVHTLNGDVGSLLRDSALVIVTVPDILPVREQILDWVKKNAAERNPALVFVRGGQGGLIYLLARHRADKALSNASLILVEDSFYGTRFIANKIEFKRKKRTNVALAGPNSDKGLALLRRVFSGPSIGKDWHQFVPVRSLDLQFDPLGYIIHLGVALDDKNLERTRRGDRYLHYSEGVHAENSEKLEELDKERVALASHYGANTRLFTDMLEEQYGLPRKPTFLETIQETKSIYRSRSAESLIDLKEGRVLQEDIPALLTIDWLTERAGIDLPATRAHTREVVRKVESLGLKLDAFSGYRRELEHLSLKRSDVIDLLTA
ncbi:hypothetical protein BBJ41_37385 [Burkholderia stabilis]|uniref:NAD/NADP octopine/nopaline dehydrogenase family protein n=1 Tax=Burkholderia stabilis TaxID=95485 RepID=UPI000851B9FF|nr:NAD/NADP octopine/nopaline dehydrogenase family protein [Burkholderia stabilis]AOR73209.1 hypothetical protein BBJ41_37385 [Burkholderia stabilis]